MHHMSYLTIVCFNRNCFLLHKRNLFFEIFATQSIFVLSPLFYTQIYDFSNTKTIAMFVKNAPFLLLGINNHAGEAETLVVGYQDMVVRRIYELR